MTPLREDGTVSLVDAQEAFSKFIISFIVYIRLLF